MIREFMLGDEKGIAALEKECFSSPWSENAILESYVADTSFFVFTDNENILGYAGLQIVLDEGYVTNIAVTEEARGKGIGGVLAETLVAFAKEKGLAFISLEVRESNTPAISLYKKFGFEDMGRRKAFYQHPTEDAIIMTKEF
ncbi:MAG: ribosomal protein S18-alanine N-acetyltransferase [Clostridia bacterium]|nr:ribosomal protein S18-alanine N-acetyltransferase [Clostridia bacterium]